MLIRAAFASLLAALLVLAGCPSPMTTPDGGTSPGNDAATDTGVHADGPTHPPDAVTQDSSTTGDAGPDGGVCAALALPGCNPVTSAGCTTGMGCYEGLAPDGGVAGQCVGPGQIGVGGWGATCTADTDCQPGFACLGMAGSSASTCTKLCCAAGDNASCRTGSGAMNGATCSIGITDSPLFACQMAVACDWFAQDCPNGGACIATDSAGSTTCQPAGPGRAGAQCGGTPAADGGALVQCAAGYDCVGDTSSGNFFCRQICDGSLAAGADAGPAPDGGVSRTCSGSTQCIRINSRWDPLESTCRHASLSIL